MSAADTAPAPLEKVDSAISGLSSSPPDDKAPVKGHRRASSSAAGVYNINDLGESTTALNDNDQRWLLPDVTQERGAEKCIEKEGKEITIAKETQKLNW